jgi:hypothetical protein
MTSARSVVLTDSKYSISNFSHCSRSMYICSIGFPYFLLNGPSLRKRSFALIHSSLEYSTASEKGELSAVFLCSCIYEDSAYTKVLVSSGVKLFRLINYLKQRSIHVEVFALIVSLSTRAPDERHARALVIANSRAASCTYDCVVNVSVHSH